MRFRPVLNFFLNLFSGSEPVDPPAEPKKTEAVSTPAPASVPAPAAEPKENIWVRRSQRTEAQNASLNVSLSLPKNFSHQFCYSN